MAGGDNEGKGGMHDASQSAALRQGRQRGLLKLPGMVSTHWHVWRRTPPDQSTNAR